MVPYQPLETDLDPSTAIVSEGKALTDDPKVPDESTYCLQILRSVVIIFKNTFEQFLL